MSGSLVRCAQCGSEFERAARGPVPRYCSGTCRARACDARARVDGRLVKWRNTSAERNRKPTVELSCDYCGRTYESNRTDRAHCGDPRCRAKWHSKRMGPYVQARRAAKAGVAAESFAAAEIFERDAHRCWICGDEALIEVPKTHPLRATLEHVVPLSRGGAHTRANVRCAHLICNLQKGDRVLPERLPLRDVR
jgi:5-methylcytosine-specific restriction endonuclease McrA